jgi:phosphoglycolate phosphatase-like HAD superfamily hydrolase
MGHLVLWDVDGTLLRTPGIGVAAMHRALERVVGVAPAGTVRFAGMLDSEIALAYLEAMNADPEVYLQRVLAACVEELEAAREDIAERGWVLPGVTNALAALDKERGVRQTLLTGNLRANAILKVSVLGLDPWLDLEVGAYGEDARRRHELVPVALERVATLRNRTYHRGEVWVIGDSENDLASAKTAGARCLLVGTGWGLPGGAAEEADGFMDTMSDTDAVLDVILG